MVRLVRYAAVGMVNSAISLSVILVGLRCGLGDYLANLFGYAAGLCFSFFANRRWTFDFKGAVMGREVAGFGSAVVIAYAVNLLILAGARAGGVVDNGLVHLAGMVGYSVVCFFLTTRLAYPPKEWPRHAVRAFLTSHAPELALCAMAGTTLACIASINLTHDVVWQFWIARQLLAGAHLYTDIWEVNPPLWFWSAVPVDYIAQLIGISPYRLLIPLIVGTGALSAMMAGHLANFPRPSQRFIFMALAFWFSVPMPLFDFAQREQLALICSLPYIALIACRCDRRQVPFGIALAIGFFAAYGFALKHYFTAVPLLLEGLVALRLRKDWRLVRPETSALAISCALYAAAVLLFAPEFLTFMVPILNIAYFGYEEHWLLWFDEPAQAVWLLGLIALYIIRRRAGPNDSALTTALYFAAVGFAFSYFAQRKGWQYHAIPVTGALLLAIVTRTIKDGISQVWRYPLALFSIGLAISVSLAFGPYNDILRSGSEPLLKGVRPGQSVAILSPDPMWTWPVIEERHFKWPLRFYSLWMIPAIAHAEIRGPHSPALEGLADRIRRETLDDMRCTPPEVILIERRTRYHYQPRSFDVTGFFRRDPDLRTFMDHNYSEEPATKSFRVFHRSRPIDRMTGGACRNITIAPFTIG